MITTLWTIWAVLAVLGFIGAMRMERSAVKVDGAAGWLTFGWFGIFILWGIPFMAVLSLGIWLSRTLL